MYGDIQFGTVVGTETKTTRAGRPFECGIVTLDDSGRQAQFAYQEYPAYKAWNLKPGDRVAVVITKVWETGEPKAWAMLGPHELFETWNSERG